MESLKNSNIDLIVVDEILDCLQNKLIYEDELVLALENKAKSIEVALSGDVVQKNYNQLPT